MAGYKSLGVLLAVAALLAAAARAVDDEHMYHWKCFKSCTGTCGSHDEDSAGHHSGGKCKDRCLSECFEDLPAHCYHQCVVTNCLHLPPFSNEKVVCLKSCCDQCFHHGPPAPGPGPKPPGPPKPRPPTPGPPKPSPPKPAPPKPKPPTPAPPKPQPPAPKPKPPTPKAPPAPKPKPKPPTPKAPPPPKKPCPPGSDEVKDNDNN